MAEREPTFKEKMYKEFGRTLVYDPINQLFIVGNGSGKTKAFSLVPQEFEVEVVKDIGDFYVQEKDVPLGIIERDHPYYLIMSGFDIDITPALKKYIESLSFEEMKAMRKLVCEVMAKVVSDLTTIKPREDEGGFMGISMQPMENGNFVLQTIGNCACLGPEMYRTRTDENTSDFPQPYGLHNADMPWQRLCLYAGLGAMAWYAEVESARDI